MVVEKRQISNDCVWVGRWAQPCYMLNIKDALATAEIHWSSKVVKMLADALCDSSRHERHRVQYRRSVLLLAVCGKLKG